MSKKLGKKIGIKFTDDILGDGIFNKEAFTISWDEYLFVNGPNDNGPLINKSYKPATVERHVDGLDTILLTMNDNEEFNSVVGNVNVYYDSEIGNLFGRDGIVESFDCLLTPEDLVSLANPGVSELVKAQAGEIVLDLKPITYIEISTTDEHLKVKPGNVYLDLINVADINP